MRQGIGNTLEVEVLKHQLFDGVSHNEIADTVWDVLRGQVVENLTVKELKSIQKDFTYVQLISATCVAFGGSLKESNLLMKRYRQKTKTILLWRSVIEDELYPLTPGHLRCADSVWFVIENRPKNQAAVKVILKIRPPLGACGNQPVGIVSEMIIQSVVANSNQLADVINFRVEEKKKKKKMALHNFDQSVTTSEELYPLSFVEPATEPATEP